MCSCYDIFSIEMETGKWTYPRPCTNTRIFSSFLLECHCHDTHLKIKHETIVTNITNIRCCYQHIKRIIHRWRFQLNMSALTTPQELFMLISMLRLWTAPLVAYHLQHHSNNVFLLRHILHWNWSRPMDLSTSMYNYSYIFILLVRVPLPWHSSKNKTWDNRY